MLYICCNVYVALNTFYISWRYIFTNTDYRVKSDSRSLRNKGRSPGRCIDEIQTPYLCTHYSYLHCSTVLSLRSWVENIAKKLNQVPKINAFVYPAMRTLNFTEEICRSLNILTQLYLGMFCHKGQMCTHLNVGVSLH